jgi:hypothetical protein
MIAQTASDSWSELLTSSQLAKSQRWLLSHSMTSESECEQSCTESSVLFCHRYSEGEIDEAGFCFLPQAAGDV